MVRSFSKINWNMHWSSIWTNITVLFVKGNIMITAKVMMLVLMIHTEGAHHKSESASMTSQEVLGAAHCQRLGKAWKGQLTSRKYACYWTGRVEDGPTKDDIKQAK